MLRICDEKLFSRISELGFPMYLSETVSLISAETFDDNDRQNDDNGGQNEMIIIKMSKRQYRRMTGSW